MGKKKVPDLYRAPFPLYSVKVDPDTGLVIIAGGGGASKTGIKNAVHFLDLQLVGECQHSASLLHCHDTDTRATMNMAVGKGVIAAGQDGSCCLMQFKQCTQKEGKDANKDGKSKQQGNARLRAGKGDKCGQDGVTPSGNTSDMKDETTRISVTALAEVQSDLNPQDPLQKVVRFSPDQSLLLTGGTDGHVRVWEFPSLKKKFDFKAHEGEIEDLDISPGNKHLVTVGRDFACSVWSGNQLSMSLKWHETVSHIDEKTYRYLACRFGKVEDQKDALRLYTVQIPHKRDRKPPPCYLTKWDGRSLLAMLTAPCGAEVISSLAVRLYYVHESHGIVVTDLAFLPHSVKGKNIKGSNETALLSVAVDSRCQLHRVARRRYFPVWLVLFFCGVLVVGVVLLLQHLFPGFI
ncbi:prolactin regulatory element-binding protein [Neolamprologus brichardi]|uniref:prolactin regulatory element-binding protein n=1 Tax=Neolamprologus brichardi TaxID=32507 RepID=UPI0003EC39B3|nr:prolactin regulatory element-binding protein [Neolamprologus brichardi]